MPLSVVWLNNNLVDGPEKAIAAALQMGFGNGFNFVSNNVFITAQGPRYRTAFGIRTSFEVIGGLATVLLMTPLYRENRKLDERNAIEENATGVYTTIICGGTKFRNPL